MWKNEIEYSDMVTTQPQGAGPMEDGHFTIEELYQAFKKRMIQEFNSGDWVEKGVEDNE